MENVKRRYRLRNISVEERIILKWSRKRLIWLRIVPNRGLLWTRLWTFRLQKMWGNLLAKWVKTELAQSVCGHANADRCVSSIPERQVTEGTWKVAVQLQAKQISLHADQRTKAKMSVTMVPGSIFHVRTAFRTSATFCADFAEQGLGQHNLRFTQTSA